MAKDTPVYQVKLERVIGLTVSSNAAIDCDANTEQIAYSAGCTVVVYNPRKNRQMHIVNTCRKTITSVAYSPDGRFLVTGESGHLPSVRLWELPSEPGTPAVQVAEFPGHKYGINCVAFSPVHKYVVSVGSQHDMIVNVWDWRSHVKVASNKVSAKVKAVSFAENGSYFVTVGNRHVKFWYLERSRSTKYKEPVPLMGRSAILGEQRNNYFCDVACGRGDMADSTYAITKSGLLCEFNNRRLLDKWVELRTPSANCLALGADYIFIGCAEGIVRCFSPHTLAFVTTLPRTHYLGVDVALGLNIRHMTQHPNNSNYPDAIALAYDPVNAKLTCVYNDHSLYIWDVRDIKRVGKAHSFLFHSACIWGVDVYPGGPALPPATLVTCSSDDTIRFWHLDSAQLPNGPSPYRNNIYSDELLKVVYVDDQMTFLKDLDLSGANGGSGGQSERPGDGSYDGHNGVRTIRFSPDGKHLASGDRLGNIRIHDLMTLTELCLIQAHDAEVLCLEYNRQDSEYHFLASASRDRLIHLFNVDKGYEIVQTLDDHSSSITAVRFLEMHDQLQLVSCGADKSIIFRQMQQGSSGQSVQFSRGHNVAGKTTLYDMEVDSGQKHVLTACQDRNIRVYSVSSGKHTKTFKGSVGEDGSLIKVVLDPSGIYAATSCTDKTLCVYDYYSCELMATMLGHSELVTGLRFTEDCQRLVSASGDGCLFVWRLPHDMIVTMHARLSQQSARAARKTPISTNGITLDNEAFGPPSPSMMDPNANNVANDYRFTISPLPLWAKKQISTSTDTNTTGIGGGGRGGPDLPRGRWAQRVGQAGWGITVKSVYNNDSLITYPINQDGSKDSSIDSGTDTKQPEPRREQIFPRQDDQDDFTPCDESFQEIMNSPRSLQIDSPHKSVTTRVNELSDLTRARQLTDDSSLGSFKYEDLEGTEHDGDIEDYSEGDGETTEPEQSNRLMYYPAVEESGSEYKVNAMDVEELRRSQRMKKSQQANRLLTTPEFSGFSASATSVSGSQESDDDDEDLSTPSGENTYRIITHSPSIESIDIIGTREKYLKSTFESLGNSGDQDNKDLVGNSISSQHHTTRSLMPPPPPPKPSILLNSKNGGTLTSNPRKRDELNKRIEETRRKLQSVGRSNLKTSKSISDLSHRPIENTSNGLHTRRYIGGKKYYTNVLKNRTNSLKVKPKYTNSTSTFNTEIDANITRASLQLSNYLESKVETLNMQNFDIKPSEEKNNVRRMRSLPLDDVESLKPERDYNTLPTMKPTKEISTTVRRIDGICSTSSSPVKRCTQKPKAWLLEFDSKSKRPGFLNLATSPRKNWKFPNHSLPESPVYEEPGTQEYSRTRRSCSYYIDLNSYTDMAKSLDVLPGKPNIDENKTQNAQSAENLDEAGFSSDSLEEPSEFSLRTPRRSASDYGLFNRPFTEYKGHNASQESLLSEDTSCQISSCSGDILDLCQDRHSSASFFLAIGPTKSQESILSILTDDDGLEDAEDTKSIELDSNSRKVFRTRSLQDTSEKIISKQQNNFISEKERKITHKPPPKPRKSTGKALPSRIISAEQERPPWSPYTTKPKTPTTPSPLPINQSSSISDVDESTAGVVVKLLCRSFEQMYQAPVSPAMPASSNSSTPPTSSSVSPKRAWPPASRAPLKPHTSRNRPMMSGKQVLPDKPVSVENLDSESNMLRRVCSLSDLSAPKKVVHAKPIQVSGKLTSKNNLNSRTMTRHQNKVPSGMNNMTRSTSMVILNHSDSESDIIPNQKNSNLSRIKGLMRPTISSQNKINSLAKSNSTTFQLPRRRNITPAYPSVNVTLASNTEDSSSEEAVTPSSNCKPTVRPRSASVDRGQTIPEPRPRIRPSNLEASPQELPVKDTDTSVVDVSNAPLSQQLCSSVADQLTRTAGDVVQLYKRLALEGQRTDSSEMLRDLAEAINEAQSTLNLVVSGNSLQGTGSNLFSNDNTGGLDNNMTAFAQTYSDLLINIFQQRISKSNNTNTTSTSNHNTPDKN